MRRILLVLALQAPAHAAAQDVTSARPFTYLIRGGMVVDGTGAPAFQGDVAVTGDRIVRRNTPWRP